MARDSHQIKWMDAYKAVEEHSKIIQHYRRAYNNCSPAKAEYHFGLDREKFFSKSEEPPIIYDKVTATWRGAEVRLPREKFGLIREGANPNSLRYRIHRRVGEIGQQYFTSDEFLKLLAEMFGESKAEGKFAQVRARGIAKKHKPTNLWHLWCTPPPDEKEFPLGTGDLVLDDYARKYGRMPGLFHKLPDKPYSRESSEVLKWISDTNSNPDLDWCQNEYYRAMKHKVIVYDGKIKNGRSGKNFGIFAHEEYLSEQQQAEICEDAPRKVGEAEEPKDDSRYLVWDDENKRFLVGQKRNALRDSTVEHIEWMERMTPKKAASFFRQHITFSFDVERFMEEATNEAYGLLFEHSNGDFEGYAKVEARNEREKQEKQKSAERKQAEESERKASNQKRNERLEMEACRLREWLPPNSDYKTAEQVAMRTNSQDRSYISGWDILMFAEKNGQIIKDPETGTFSPVQIAA